MKYEVRDELPPGRTVREEPIDWEGAKQAMIDNEGSWVKIVENVSTSTPQQLRRGDNRLFRGEELKHFEFVTRKPEDPEVAASYRANFTDIWGRYSAKVSRQLADDEKPKRGRRARS